MSNRFDLYGECRCVHITDGTCKQGSICEVCELYEEQKMQGRSLYPWEYYHTGSGTIRDKRTTSMAARPYYNYY